MKPATYHERLRKKMDDYAHLVYRLTRSFPDDERYGVVSQLRRSALSVVLNYIEGYARGRDKIHKNFLEISYGSLKESRYLLDFSLAERYVSRADHQDAVELVDEIGAMLWGVINKL